MEPVTETPEVRAAREEHERLWKEAARLNGVDVDTNIAADETETEEELEGQVSNQHQSLIRYPNLPYSKHLSASNARDFGAVNDDSVIVEAPNAKRVVRQQAEEETATSEPRGFFYSFDYPVPYIRASRMSFDEQPTNSENPTRGARHAVDFSKNVQVADDDDHVKPKEQLKKVNRGRGSIKFKQMSI